MPNDIPRPDIKTKVYPTMSDFEQYVESQYTSSSHGSNGIYGETYGTVYGNYFKNNQGLTVTTALYSIVSMELPQSPDNRYIYSFDKQALRALHQLPPSPNGTDPSQWWAKYAPIWRTFFEKFGEEAVVQASMGGMVELYSTYTDKGMTTDQLTTDAQIDFSTLTGWESKSGSHDPKITNQPLKCLGGDNTLCNKAGISGGSWGGSTRTSPVLLEYQYVPLDQFIIEPDFTADQKEAISQAKQSYIAEKQQQVQWSWDVSAIGGTCNKAQKSGSTLVANGGSKMVSECNNGCDIKLECQKDGTGRLIAVHTGCNGDSYSGTPSPGGCSVIIANGKPDATAGQCCFVSSSRFAK